MFYYSAVPKTLEENLKWRRHVYAHANASKRKREALWEVCKNDILFWCNTFLFTFDPRKPDSSIPFITYPFQDGGILKIQDCIKTSKVLMMRKSRDMGASWMSVLTMDHCATFNRGQRFIMMSYIADLVDKKGSPKSLFWKLDFIHDMLPEWLRPECDRRILGCEYRKMLGTVDGVSTTDRSNIGDRATAAFIDELSRFEPADADAVMSGLADVTRCRIYNFTRNPVMGKNHPSHRLVEQWQRGDIEGLQMHWMEHPEKRIGLYRVDRRSGVIETLDKEYDFKDYKFQRDGRFALHSVWFDRERRERGNDRHMAEQNEFEDESSGFNVFESDMIEDYVMNNCRPPNIEGDLVFDKDSGSPLEFVKCVGGPIKLWMDLDNVNNPPAVKFVAGTDISLGVGATNSCFSAARVDTGEKVLEFVTPSMKPDAFAIKCVAICLWLSNRGFRTQLCWEMQGPGKTFGDQVIKMNYSPVYMPEDTQLLERPIARRPGWNPSRANKATLLTVYRTSLSTGDFFNPSKIAILECKEWVEDPVKGPVHSKTLGKIIDPSGARDNHGDRVIADAQCAMQVIELGGGAAAKTVAKNLERSPPVGSFAWHEMQMELGQKKDYTLYPNWRKRR